MRAAASFAAATPYPKFGEFWEPNTRYIESTVDARKMPGFELKDNLTIRGIVVPVAKDTYACFDTDLLRWSAVWHGGTLKWAAMAPISYNNAGKKNGVGQTALNQPDGEGISAIGLYPGVGTGGVLLSDPRKHGLDEHELGRGPVATSIGRWEGLYTIGRETKLHYTINGVDVFEHLDAAGSERSIGYGRNIELGAHAAELFVVVADCSAAKSTVVVSARAKQVMIKADLAGKGNVIYVARVTAGDAKLEFTRATLVCRIPASASSRQQVRVELIQCGFSEDGKVSPAGPARKFEMPLEPEGGVKHWGPEVAVRGRLAADDAAYVVDRIDLPEPNPWNRRVRPSSVCFLPDGTAAVVTFDGDVWKVSDITADLKKPLWRRIAAGLNEPQSIHYYKGQLYVYSRNGIVKLVDLNGDGEIDYYENFANCFAHSAETRDFAMDMVIGRDGSFYLARGGQQEGFLGINNAAVIKVSADGREAHLFSTGLREPYLGYNPKHDLLTASDQQGNWIPTTPIQWLREGRTYGFRPATEIVPPSQPPTEAITWIPYQVSQSAAGQVWALTDKLGPLKDRMILLDYYHPRILVAFFDSLDHPMQGAVIAPDLPISFPLLKGDINPKDGDMYLIGFRIWGSIAKEWAGFGRLRYTGKPVLQPCYARTGSKGLLVQFPEELDGAFSTNLANFNLQRWNYHRTANYGSGHFKLDDTAGQEFVPMGGVFMSQDGKSLFFHVPTMPPVMQMELGYRVKYAGGREFSGTVDFTVHEAETLDLKSLGFPAIDWSRWQPVSAALAQGAAEQPASAGEGERLYMTMGCTSCHSMDGTTTGRIGPSFMGLIGREREFAKGTPLVADEAYIRQSILQPQAKIVKEFAGLESGMPSYEGILSESQIQSIVLFIKSLSRAPQGN